MDVYPLLSSFRHGSLMTALGLLLYTLARIIYNLYFHSISRFPGPRGAVITKWWLAYTLLRGANLSALRADLHQKYGDIIRIAPNELHFPRPTVYDEIYNSQNKWDKIITYTREYLKSKHRRALISNMFSRRGISEIQHLIRDQLDRFCGFLKEQNAADKSSNLYLGFQCFAADTISNFLFATCFDQLSFPDFQGDIIKGVDVAFTAITLGRFSAVLYGSSKARGLMVFKRALESQVKSVLQNPELLDDAPHRVIYNELLDPYANKGLAPPTASRLYDDARTLFEAGSHSTGITLMTGVFYILRNPEAKQRLVDEVYTVWPVLDQAPSYGQLEKLPFSTAVIKEALRICMAISSSLPRVVPPSGAVISGVKIPGGTVVGQSPFFVSFSEEIFARPHEFLPDRWLQPGSKALENHPVVFSKGPHSCLGINLAYCELYLTFAYLFRRFDVREDPKKLAILRWSEHFAPVFEGQHLRAYCVPRSE